MKNNSPLDQLLIFIQVILIELSTRSMSKKLDKENINLAEMLNDTFITAENLRNELKKFVGQSDSNLIYSRMKARTINEMIHYIEKLMTFQNKWNISYTSWLSSFKAQRNNKNSLIAGEEYLHLNYQTLYPNFRKFHRDTDDLMLETNYYLDMFECYKLYLETEQEWKRKSFLSRILATKPAKGKQP